MGLFDHAIETVTKYVKPVENAIHISLIEDLKNKNVKNLV